MSFWTLDYVVNQVADFRLEHIRTRDKRVVYCHGVFDLLHLGHIRHLKAARDMGDFLVVTITSDAHVNKGPDRPLIPELERAEMVEALECVDAVAISTWPTAVEAIRSIWPDLYVKGAEYNGHPTLQLMKELEALKDGNGKLAFTPPSRYSTTKLIRGIKGCEPLTGVIHDEE